MKRWKGPDSLDKKGRHSSRQILLQTTVLNWMARTESSDLQILQAVVEHSKKTSPFPQAQYPFAAFPNANLPHAFTQTFPERQLTKKESKEVSKLELAFHLLNWKVRNENLFESIARTIRLAKKLVSALECVHKAPIHNHGDEANRRLPPHIDLLFISKKGKTSCEKAIKEFIKNGQERPTSPPPNSFSEFSDWLGKKSEVETDDNEHNEVDQYPTTLATGKKTAEDQFNRWISAQVADFGPNRTQLGQSEHLRLMLDQLKRLSTLPSMFENWHLVEEALTLSPKGRHLISICENIEEQMKETILLAPYSKAVIASIANALKQLAEIGNSYSDDTEDLDDGHLDLVPNFIPSEVRYYLAVIGSTLLKTIDDEDFKAFEMLEDDAANFLLKLCDSTREKKDYEWLRRNMITRRLYIDEKIHNIIISSAEGGRLLKLCEHDAFDDWEGGDQPEKVAIDDIVLTDPQALDFAGFFNNQN